MPIIKSAKKAARQTTKRTAKNVEIKKNIKAALKAFKSNPTAENMQKIQSEYDKAVKKGLLKKNTASRRKARVAKLAKDLSGVKAQPKKSAAKKPATKPAAKAPAKAPAKKPAAKKPTTKQA